MATLPSPAALPRLVPESLQEGSWNELHEDGRVYRHVLWRGRYTMHHHCNVCVGTIDEIERKRPDLLPTIVNYERAEFRGVIPDPSDFTLDELVTKLATMEDKAVIKRMMKLDGREAAEEWYIRRLEELDDASRKVAVKK